MRLVVPATALVAFAVLAASAPAGRPTSDHRIVLLGPGGEPYARLALDGDVTGAGSDGAGGWYVGGTFRHVDGGVHVHLVHVLRDGRVDPRWRATVDRHSAAYGFGVQGLVRLGRDVYVSGTFEFADGEYRAGLASFDALTGALAPWRPPIAGWDVYDDIAAAGGRIVLAGCFRVDGREIVVAVDARSGRMDPAWGPSLEPTSSPCAYGEVYGLAVSARALYLIGTFRRGFVALDRRDGALLTSFRPPDLAGASGQLLSLAASGGRVFVAYSHGLVQQFGLLALDSRSGRVVRAWHDGCALAGGNLVTAGGRLYVWTHQLCALDVRTGRREPAWRPPPGMLLATVAASGRRLLVAD